MWVNPVLQFSFNSPQNEPFLTAGKYASVKVFQASLSQSQIGNHLVCFEEILVEIFTLSKYLRFLLGYLQLNRPLVFKVFAE
jgi:hypothetical protein